MTDLPILAAALLANFATICIPRCERLWTWPVANPPPKLREKFLSTAIAGERLIIGYHREYLRYRLLERGHHAFLDRLEGGGSEGWHLHFFCLVQRHQELPLWRQQELAPLSVSLFDL